MSAIDDVLASIPKDQLARQLGTDPATAERATRQALPALLGSAAGGRRARSGSAAGEALLQRMPR